MYRVQINMAEFGDPALWEDVEIPKFRSRVLAEANIDWMKREYGGNIEYRIVEDAIFKDETRC